MNYRTVEVYGTQFDVEYDEADWDYNARRPFIKAITLPQDKARTDLTDLLCPKVEDAIEDAFKMTYAWAQVA